MKDWYYAEGLFAETPEECADIWYKLKDTNEQIFVKYKIIDQADFSKRFVSQALKNGATEAELRAIRFGTTSGLTIFMN